MKAIAVPTGKPCLISVSITGITPLAFAYKGIPNITAIGTLNYLFVMIGALLGNQVLAPAPILHYFGISFANAYMAFMCTAFQIAFWARHFEIL